MVRPIPSATLSLVQEPPQHAGGLLGVQEPRFPAAPDWTDQGVHLSPDPPIGSVRGGKRRGEVREGALDRWNGLAVEIDGRRAR